MNFRLLKSRLLVAVLLGSAGLFTACMDDLELGKPVDESSYLNIYQNNIYLCDAKSELSSTVVELFDDTYETSLKLGMTKAVEAMAKVKIAVDADYLTTYNNEHGTNFELYPQDLISLTDEGVITIHPGSKFGEIGLTIRAGEAVVEDRTFVIPLAIAEQGDNLSLKEGARHCVYLVKDMRNAADCNKGDGATKAILFFEVNDVNPLNTLSFQLENGKLLWDAIVLFAANINYDSNAQRPYIKCNPNVQFLLDNNDVYLQPLRKRGVKVILGLLGNHDMAGLAQLSEQGARDFAREVAEYCRVYNLDGVNYDDEYSLYPDVTNPAFATPGTEAAARLCYETKLAMPDKLVTVYAYENMYGTSSVDGVDIDNWMDIVVPNYGGFVYPLGNLQMSKLAGTSVELNNGRGMLSVRIAENILERGFGWFMGFAPKPDNYPEIRDWLIGVETLYGYPLAPYTIYYKKNDPKPYPYSPDDFVKPDDGKPDEKPDTKPEDK